MAFYPRLRPLLRRLREGRPGQRAAGKKFSEDEINVLLERNGGKVQWKPEGLNGKPHEVFYQNVKHLYPLWTGFEDGQAVLKAEYLDDSLNEKPRPCLTISTLEYAKLSEATVEANAEADWQKTVQNRGAAQGMSAEEFKQLNQEAQASKEQEAKKKEQEKQDALKSTEGL